MSSELRRRDGTDGPTVSLTIRAEIHAGEQVSPLRPVFGSSPRIGGNTSLRDDRRRPDRRSATRRTRCSRRRCERPGLHRNGYVRRTTSVTVSESRRRHTWVRLLRWPEKPTPRTFKSCAVQTNSSLTRSQQSLAYSQPWMRTRPGKPGSVSVETARRRRDHDTTLTRSSGSILAPNRVVHERLRVRNSALRRGGQAP